MEDRIRILCNDLASVKRRGWLARGIPEADCESVADHSHAVAVYCQLYAPEEYRDRAMEIALVHDLGEVITGDIIPADGISKDRKKTLEELAFEYFQSTSPAAQEVKQRWLEYEENSTLAAQFVRDADKLQRLDRASYYARKYPDCDLSDFKKDRNAIRHPGLQNKAEKLLTQWNEWANQPTRQYILVTGGPGVGKGTQCALAAEALDAVHLSAGELLRSEMERPGTSLRDFIANSFKRNVPVPARLIISLMLATINQQSKTLVILDGFPYSRNQLEHFENEISRSYIIVQLQARDQILKERLMERANSSRRMDDTADLLQSRIDSFKNRQKEIVQLLTMRGQEVVEIDGEGAIADVQTKFLDAITL